MSQLIVCIPVREMADYPEVSAKRNGNTPDLYQPTDCPDCHQPMWLGPRVKALMESGVRATCAYCAVLVHHVRDASNMTVLASMDKQ